MSCTHIVFGHSAGKDLRDGLANASRKDTVLIFPDNLSLGPIDPPDWDERAKWMRDELLYEIRDLSEEIDTFWAAALARDNNPIAWFSRRSTLEYANFLEWLWRMGTSPCEIVDLTEVIFQSRGGEGGLLAPRFVVSLAMIPSKTIQARKLWDFAVPLSKREREHYRRLWGKLKEENAPLRIIREGELTSASLDVFDQTIMTFVSTKWQKLSRVIGEVLGAAWQEQCQQVGDGVLQARVRALVESGLLEGRGDLSSMREGQVRLPDVC